MSNQGNPESTERGRGGIQSLHRAFDILSVVAQYDVVGATKIAREIGLPVSTINNLCRTMVARGYLIGRRGQYRIGPAFSTLSTRWNPMVALPDVVAPRLQTLSESTGHAAVAVVLTGREASVVAFEQGRGPIVTPPPRSGRRALALPTGTILVALSRRTQWADFIADCAEHSDSPLDRPSLLRELEDVSRQNVCGRRSEDPHGQTALAVPVWTTAATVACAIGVSAPTYVVDAATEQHMWTTLVAAAAEVSAELGASTIPEVSRTFTWRRTH